MRPKLLLLVALVAVIAVLVWSWFPSPKEPPYQASFTFGEAAGLAGPIGIALLDGEVFVSDAGNHRILVFGKDGQLRRTFGGEGEGPGELDRPMHIDASDGKLFVAEYGNDRIQVFSPAGEPLDILGGPGDGPGAFDAPGGVTVAADGTVYVADFYNQRVQALDGSGRFLRQWGTTGKKSILWGRFNYPTDVALLPDGSLVVADAYNDRIQVFDREGKFTSAWGGPFALNLRGGAPGWFRTATGVAVDSKGNVFVADFENHRIQKLTSGGTFLVAFGEAELDRPTDAVVDETGRVYVVDFGHDRIQVYDPPDGGSAQ